MKKAIINILLIGFLGVLLFSGYRLYSIFSEYRKGRVQYEKTAEQYMTEKDDTGEESGHAEDSQDHLPGGV
jgi:cbb3-type cytochrome oxidase subunit 3